MSADNDQNVQGPMDNSGQNQAQGEPVRSPTAIGISPEQESEIRRWQQQQQRQSHTFSTKPKSNRKSLIGSLVGIIIVIAVAYAVVALILPRLTVITTTTSPPTSVTTTIPHVLSFGCQVIDEPGYQQLVNPLKYGNLSGACVYVTASNVRIVCNQNRIEGSGPFADVAPFSYGIEVYDANNVSITGCIISNFSYGIMAISATNLSLRNDNISSNYVSNIYLNKSPNSSIVDNYISKAESQQGAIYIASTSPNSKVYNNTIQYNTFYGIKLNSTNNRFFGNRINGTPVSFYCSLNSSFPTSSTAQDNICYNDTGCGFLQCMGTNIPSNVSKIALGNTISSCGSINLPGTYRLSGNINMANFVNAASLASYTSELPCIRVAASNVNLNCRNFTISNASVGLQFANGADLTLDGCNFKNSQIGMLLDNISASHIYNVTFTKNVKGVLIENATDVFISNIKSSNNTFGYYLLNAAAIEANYFNTSYNLYGIYSNNSVGDIFNSGRSSNNTQLDVYSSPNYAGAQYATWQSSDCGSTNAQWASCIYVKSVTLNYSVLTSCVPIDAPGNYIISGLIFATTDCIKIGASNVDLNCKGNRIIPLSTSAFGYAIDVANENNVTIQNCTVAGFQYGLDAYNVSGLDVSHLNAVSTANIGFNLTDITRSSITNSTVNGSGSSGITLNNVNYSLISRNNVLYASTPQTSAYEINDSSNNIVLNNIGSSDYVGIDINGASLNNTIMDNSFPLYGHCFYISYYVPVLFNPHCAYFCA